MKRSTIHAVCSAILGILTMLSAPASRADDTEIFEAIPPTGANNRPNVLLIIDTSFSMTGNVTTQEDWDPSLTYTGASGDSCSTSYVYWQAAGSTTLPSCSGSNQQRVSASNFVCQAAASQMSAGGQVTLGETLQWKNSGTKRWEALQAGRDTYVECKTDHPNSGTHSGVAANDNQVARDGNSGPFSSSNAITNWGAASYTFYTGNRLNYLKNGGTTVRTRLQIVKSSAKEMLDQLLDGSVNVGLMRFQNRSYSNGHAEGGYVLHEVAPIETVRATLKTQIDALNAVSYTPLTETLFEAWRYYSGGRVYFGNDSPSSYSVASSRQTADTTRYQSPMANSCQTNYIVLLTDGEATGDSSADSRIQALTNFSTRAGGAAVANCTANVTVSGSGDGTGVCLDDLAQYMWRRPDIANAEDKIGKKIQTYTIGFGDEVGASTNLQGAASLGGGQYYVAGDSASLAAAFSNVLRNIISTNVTFTSPTISVNAFNRTRNFNDLFFTVFQPSDSFHWPGNIKKYRINADGVIVDANGLPAVNATTGFFDRNATSYWSTGADGDIVQRGGAANKIPNGGAAPASGLRKVYTDVNVTAGPQPILSNATNALSTGNTLITANPTLLGLPATATTAEVDELITWGRGEMPDGSQRYEIGDPLHSRPVAVVYGGTATAPDMTVYAATNDGYLHAIDSSTGVELWSFIPSTMLSRLAELRDNDNVAQKQYGIDGNLTIYQTDTGTKGIVDGTDIVMLYFGLGRGGSEYYALNITDRANPKLVWKNGAAGSMVGLAQSWSTPVVVNVNVDGTRKPVIIVGGGYDTTQDTAAANQDDTGNRIFMLDAMTGAVIWKAGPTNITGAGYDNTSHFQHASMLYSIPSDIRVLDTGTDGLADRMYVGDMGGQIWRFDIINGQPAASLVRGGVIASLGAATGSGGTSPADARRFYSPPDVSLLTVGSQRVAHIAIGSGYKGHPLNTQIQDRFYGIRDPKPFVAMTAAEYTAFSVITDTSYSVSNPTGLYDLTTDSAPSATTDPVIPSTVRGWKLHLRVTSGWEGEKVLGESRTFSGYVYFTSFTPNNSTPANTCTVRSGTNKLYQICVSGACRRAEFQLAQAGIAPEPVVIRPTPDPPGPPCTGPSCPPPTTCTGEACNKPMMLIGAEAKDVGLTYEQGRVYWKSDE